MISKYKLVTGFAFSAAFLTAIATMPSARAAMSTGETKVISNGPQANPSERSGARSVRQNVRDSQRYEALMHSNAGFRAGRLKKECGPISDPQLHASCVASFE